MARDPESSTLAPPFPPLFLASPFTPEGTLYTPPCRSCVACSRCSPCKAPARTGRQVAQGPPDPAAWPCRRPSPRRRCRRNWRIGIGSISQPCSHGQHLPEIQLRPGLMTLVNTAIPIESRPYIEKQGLHGRPVVNSRINGVSAAHAVEHLRHPTPLFCLRSRRHGKVSESACASLG